MHDIRWIRENPQQFDQEMDRRGLPAQAAQILEIDQALKTVVHQLQNLYEKKNNLTEQIFHKKKQAPLENTSNLIEENSILKQNIFDLEKQEGPLKEQLNSVLSSLPNIMLQDVPTGSDESGNQVIKTHKSSQDPLDFIPKPHYELGENLGFMDFQQAAHISGSRFTILKGPLAQLERALGQFMLDIHTQEFGYTEVSPPLLVNKSAMYGTGQLPKMQEDSFETNTGHWLIPTSEVPLTNLGSDKIFKESDFPLRYTALTPCFRSEAGAAGKDTRGMFRQHQFYKVELVSLTTPETSADELKTMLNAAEEILRRLDLTYQVVLKCTGDSGFTSQKTYDLEVWLPGQNKYREISSCSSCGSFQSRRMNGRYKKESQSKPEFFHTLNGSGLAMGRTLVAVLENYQLPDGSIKIPLVLVPYMNGKTTIQKNQLRI